MARGSLVSLITPQYFFVSTPFVVIALLNFREMLFASDFFLIIIAITLKLQVLKVK